MPVGDRFLEKMRRVGFKAGSHYVFHVPNRSLSPRFPIRQFLLLQLREPRKSREESVHVYPHVVLHLLHVDIGVVVGAV